MGRTLLCILTLFIVFPLMVLAQSKHYELDGFIHVKDGETYPYQLLLSVRGTSVRGFSITKLPNGIEPKINITGHIEREKRRLTISEKNLISELPQYSSVCLVNATMAYTQGKSKYPLSGTFIGVDKDNKPCGKGTVEFAASKYMDEIFGTDSAPAPKPAENETPEAQSGEYEITNGISRRFNWKSDTCVFEIYDGGIVDSDEVSVLFNGQNVLTTYVLTAQKKLIKFPLKKTQNTITIAAEYEGKIPPNTANVIISDGSKHYKIKAFNKPGEKAYIIINKK